MPKTRPSSCRSYLFYPTVLLIRDWKQAWPEPGETTTGSVAIDQIVAAGMDMHLKSYMMRKSFFRVIKDLIHSPDWSLATNSVLVQFLHFLLTPLSFESVAI